MIVLKISNAREVVQSKAGKLLAALSPAGMDESIVESILVRKLIENLAAEGLSGEVLSVEGLAIQDRQLVVEGGLHVAHHETF
jgi:hypothetical protein